eukprot:CAMPEP_0116830566 /NCGR_PEP_ID=MMETSP0418-20121206/4832_1 /TAXON_ID=1158023 /ORGANISM="Astrosyne radiata, Strain 13vi08-1A" /LENGTH=99 /DNA_ID=CAMNT_0004459679 /DNA_START=3 /DNA_END=299 /DNA_ORIENTATION=+
MTPWAVRMDDQQNQTRGVDTSNTDTDITQARSYSLLNPPTLTMRSLSLCRLSGKQRASEVRLPAISESMAGKECVSKADAVGTPTKKKVVHEETLAVDP